MDLLYSKLSFASYSLSLFVHTLMGSCSGKVLEKEYAGYNVPPCRKNKEGKTAIKEKSMSPRVEYNRHGLIVGMLFHNHSKFVLIYIIAPHKVQELKTHELSALLKLLNHESLEISNITYDIINGISVNGILTLKS